MLKPNTPLFLIALLFLNIGVMFCMNDILLPVVKEHFHFDYVKATMIQISFYIVYVIWPIPVARSVEKYGYRRNIIASIAFCLAGCLMFIPAYFLSSYALILAGVFTLSTGITIANVAANPYVTFLGDPAHAHMRLNFVQAFSRVGYAVTPVFASYLILSSPEKGPMIHLPYLFLSALLAVMLIVFITAGMPDIRAEAAADLPLKRTFAEAKVHKHLLWGMVAMFFYLGVESCTAGFLISYAIERSYTAQEAALFLTFYYVLAATFALVGTWLLRFLNAGTLLVIFGVGMISCLSVAVLSHDTAGIYALVGAGGCLSVMFPTVFSLAIQGLGSFTERGSALLNFAIVGGAVFPPLQGLIADERGVSDSYVVPLLCAIVVTGYGAYRRRQTAS